MVLSLESKHVWSLSISPCLYIYIHHRFKHNCRSRHLSEKSPSGSTHEPRKACVEEIGHLSKLVLAGGVQQKRIARVNRKNMVCQKALVSLNKVVVLNPYFCGGVYVKGGVGFLSIEKRTLGKKYLGFPMIQLNCQTILPFTVYSFSGETVRFGYEDIKEWKL